MHAVIVDHDGYSSAANLTNQPTVNATLPIALRRRRNLQTSKPYSSLHRQGT